MPLYTNLDGGINGCFKRSPQVKLSFSSLEKKGMFTTANVQSNCLKLTFTKKSVSNQEFFCCSLWQIHLEPVAKPTCENLLHIHNILNAWIPIEITRFR